MKCHQWEELIVSTREQVEQRLVRWFEDARPGEVTRAGRYAVLGGGHRWRALFAVAISELFEPSPEISDTVLSGAGSIEMVHAASLVLDDLPSMDNASMRRGKLCAHLEFPRWVVDMLPVFLVTAAYDLFLNSDGPFPQRHLKAAQELSRTGLRMISGQEMDLSQPQGDESAEALIECYRLKTGALWSTAGKAVAIICGADSTNVKKISKCGMNLALYYQFLDDVGDATGTVAEIGKTAGLDKDKLTAVKMYRLRGPRSTQWHFRRPP